MAMFSELYEYNRVDLKHFGEHEDEVNCVAFSPDFELMVTGSDDCAVRIFNAVSAHFVCDMLGHTAAVRCVAVSSDSKLIASGSYDKTVRVWVTCDAQGRLEFKGHTKSVECVAFSADSAKLCSGSWDRSAIIWDIHTGSSILTLSGHNDLVQTVAFSYNGKYISSGSWDYIVRLWRYDRSGDLDTENVTSLTGHTGNVHSVIFSKQHMLASGSWDRTVRLWNPRNNMLLHVMSGHTGKMITINGLLDRVLLINMVKPRWYMLVGGSDEQQSWIQALCFTSDGVYLGSACEDDTVRVWDVVDGKCVKVLEVSMMIQPMMFEVSAMESTAVQLVLVEPIAQ